MDSNDERGRLLELGWRQGVALPHEFKRVLFQGNEDADESSFALVISQDCDILSPAEPYCEALLLTGVDERDKSKARGEIARSIHIQAAFCGKDAWFEALPWNRVFFERRKLLDLVPESEFVVSRIDIVRDWLANRYSRYGTPEEFDRRFGKAKGKDKLKRSLKSRHDAISGLFIAIVPEGDVTADEVYDVTVAIVLEPETNDISGLQAADEVKGCLERVFENCEGIKAECEVVKAEEFSYETFLYMRRWNFDFISNIDAQ